MEKKIAIITGASSGIGAAGAVRFAKEGYNLVIASRREGKLNTVAEKCRAEGAEVLAVCGDMSKEEDVKNVFEKALEKFGTIDFVWSNQGVCRRRPGAAASSIAARSRTRRHCSIPSGFTAGFCI